MGVEEEFQKIIAGLFSSGDGGKQADGKPLDHLDQPANRAAVEDLFDSGYLSADALVAARDLLHQPLAWWRWTSRMLLLIGSVLILTGIVFFFAFNWQKLGHYPRFAIIEAGLIVCVAAAFLSDMDELPGKMFITAASVLTGVLLLVFGQTYNTGVDSASLYILWASFIFAWVAIAEFDILWVGWLALVNVAAGLYWHQTFLTDEPGFARLMISLALLDGFMLVLREYASISLDLDWLQALWVRRLLVITIIASLTVPTMMLIIDDHIAGTVYFIVAAVMLVCAWVGGYHYFRHIVLDLGSLTAVALSACLVAISFAVRFFDPGHMSQAVVYLILGFLVAAVFGGAVAWLRHINVSMTGEDNA